MTEEGSTSNAEDEAGSTSNSSTKSGLGRRQILKAAGVGLAATAGGALTGGKAFASHIPRPVEELVCHDAAPNDGDFCGTVGSPEVISGNRVEIVVPAGRRVTVRHLEEGETPLAEVLVRISEEIENAARFVLVATASPHPLPG